MDSLVLYCSLVTDKLRLHDVEGAGDALSSALFVATMFGLLIQTVLLVGWLAIPDCTHLLVVIH